MNKNITKAVILAGDKGISMPEQTKNIPKSLVQVGQYPIIVHIMKALQQSGIKEFYICGGYKIKELAKWFLLHREEKCSIQMTDEYLKLTPDRSILSDFTITIVDTGVNSGTAERILKMKKYIGDNDFIMAYGDIYANVDFRAGYSKFTDDKVVTICAIPYKQRYTLMKVEEDGTVTEFKEKETSKTHFINGGFMLMSSDIFKYIKPNHYDFSKDTLESSELANKISAYIYNGYWKAIDTQLDLDEINRDYESHKF